MSKKELKIILGNVIHESTLGTLTFVFGALNINLNENRVLYKNLLMTALTAIHMSEYHYETVSEGKDRNHDLYFDRIVRVYDNFKYVAEICNVDKSYVLKCLMEVSKKYRDHSDLCLRLVKKIESQMQPMARANVVVTVSPPPELPSSHSNTQPRSLNDNNAFREDTKLKKKGGSVINSNLNESVQNSNLNVPAQNSNIESPIDFKCLTMEEAIEAARQGNIVVLQDLVQNMKHTIKKIELVNEETRRQGLEEYDYIRKASKRLEANSHLWYTIYKIAATNNHIGIMALLQRASFILLSKMRNYDIDIIMANIIERGGIDTLIFILTSLELEINISNERVQCLQESTIASYIVTALKYEQYECAKYLISKFNIDFKDNRVLYDKIIEMARIENKDAMKTYDILWILQIGVSQIWTPPYGPLTLQAIRLAIVDICNNWKILNRASQNQYLHLEFQRKTLFILLRLYELLEKGQSLQNDNLEHPSAVQAK